MPGSRKDRPMSASQTSKIWYEKNELISLENGQVTLLTDSSRGLKSVCKFQICKNFANYFVNFIQKMCKNFCKKIKEVKVINLSFYSPFQKIRLTKKWVPHVQIPNQFAKILQTLCQKIVKKKLYKKLCKNLAKKFCNGIFCKTFCTSDHVNRP